MNFLVISDIHGNVEVLDKLDEEFKKADAVLFAGDFAECFKTETAKPVLNALIKKHDTIYAVLGNCDEPDFADELDAEDINTERTVIFQDGLAFAGSGGGTVFTGKTPNEREEADLISDFNVAISEKLDNLIIISHNPPKDTKCDAVNADLHAGSAAFRQFIEENKPVAVITGHIHEGRAIDNIGDTVIINPGALQEGNYATMSVEKKDGKWQVISSELKKV